jgi:hypothetical protein
MYNAYLLGKGIKKKQKKIQLDKDGKKEIFECSRRKGGFQAEKR